MLVLISLLVPDLVGPLGPLLIKTLPLLFGAPDIDFFPIYPGALNLLDVRHWVEGKVGCIATSWVLRGSWMSRIQLGEPDRLLFDQVIDACLD